MSIPFTGILGGNSGGISSALAKQVKSLNLKPLRRILIKFDPFTPESAQTRTFLENISISKVRETNPSCPIKTEILCDRSDPSVHLKLMNGETIIFKAKHLSALEMLKLMNTHVTVLAPKEEPVATVVTKAQRKK